MNSTEQIGRTLVIVGLSAMLIGALLWAGSRLPWLRLGRLPGDIAFQGEGFSFFFPVTTMILASLVLTLIFWVVRYFQR